MLFLPKFALKMDFFFWKSIWYTFQGLVIINSAILNIKKIFLEQRKNISSINSCLKFTSRALSKCNLVELGHKKLFFSNFFCRFVFLIKFYIRTELNLKKICSGKKIINFRQFFSILDHCAFWAVPSSSFGLKKSNTDKRYRYRYF